MFFGFVNLVCKASVLGKCMPLAHPMYYLISDGKFMSHAVRKSKRTLGCGDDLTFLCSRYLRINFYTWRWLNSIFSSFPFAKFCFWRRWYFCPRLPTNCNAISQWRMLNAIVDPRVIPAFALSLLVFDDWNSGRLNCSIMRLHISNGQSSRE